MSDKGPHSDGPRLVILESPFAGDVEANETYARACLRDCLKRGEAPFASHLLYPQALDDRDPDERRQGIEAGLAWGRLAEATVVYGDRGITPGMEQGIARAEAEGRPVERRSLPMQGRYAATTAGNPLVVMHRRTMPFVVHRSILCDEASDHTWKIATECGMYSPRHKADPRIIEDDLLSRSHDFERCPDCFPKARP